MTGNTPGDRRAALDLDVGPTVDEVEVQQYDGTAGFKRFRTLPFGDFKVNVSIDSSKEEATATVTGLLHGVEYRYRVRSKNAHGTSPWSSHHVVTMQAVAPTELDLTPLPLRKAMVSWDTSRNHPNTKYTVRIRPLKGTGVKEFTETGIMSSLEVELDNMLDAKHPGTMTLSTVDVYRSLADAPYAYEVRVKATGAGGNLVDSNFGETLIIIDTPITQADGNSPSGFGRASLTWNAIESAAVLNSATYAGGNYHFRIRDLSGDHRQEDWNPSYLNPWKTSPVSGTSNTIDTLEHHQIYAIQLRYDLIKPSPAGGDTFRIYAARDVFVWPAPASDPYGDVTDRFATYAVFGHWPDREFHYTICEDSFSPDSDQTDWSNLIKHALKNWEESSADLVTVHPTVEDCNFSLLDLIKVSINISPINLLASSSNSTNEIYMVDTDSLLSKILRWTWVPLQFFEQCVYFASACVISQDYENEYRGASLELQRDNLLGQHISGSTDILFNEGMVSSALTTLSPTIPGGDANYDAGDIRFNTCLPKRVNHRSTAGIETDLPDYSNYSLTLHEAGHAMGLSGYSFANLLTGGYEMAHAIAADTVMNYDHEAPQNHNPMGNRVRAEPDCAPHPLDLLAIHALYQTVDRQP